MPYLKDQSEELRQFPLTSTEQIIHGLPALIVPHPSVILGNAGRLVTIADGKKISRYDLISSDRTMEARLLWSHEIDGPVTALIDTGNDRVITVISEGVHSKIDIIQNNSKFELIKIAGEVNSAVAAGSRLFLAVVRESYATAILLEIELFSGQIVSETMLSSADIVLSVSPFGKQIMISDRLNNIITMRPGSGLIPCPPNSNSSAHDDAPQGLQKDFDCNCASSGSGQSSIPGKKIDSPCIPGSAGIPDDNGGGIISNGTGISKWPTKHRQTEHPASSGDPHKNGNGPGNPLDCHGHLSWSPDRLRWAGTFILATQKNYMRKLAVLRASDMRILQERDFGNHGALVVSDPNTEVLLIYHTRGSIWEWANLMDDSVHDVLDRDGIFNILNDQKTFEGQQLFSLITGHVPTIGEVKVLVLPVVEPGQQYNEPDLTKLGRYIQRALFEPSDAYYRENSFNQTWLSFKLLGYDAGPVGKPLLLPRAVKSYFFPPFLPGGIDISLPLQGPGSSISFEGGETLVLHASPHTGGRQPDQFSLRFSACSMISDHAFPVKLMFTGSEIGVITFRDRNGNSHTLSLVFTNQVIEIPRDSIKLGLEALENFLDGIIHAAEQVAGFPNRVFAKPIASQIEKKGLDFGELHIRLEFDAALAPGRQLAAVVALNSSGLEQINFNKAIRANFSFGTDHVLFAEFISLLLRDVQYEKNYPFTSAIFSESVSISATTSMVTMSISLSDDDGGPNAVVLLKSSNFVALSAPRKGSESTKDNGNAPKEMGVFINDTFSAALARLGAGNFSVFDGFHIVVVGIVGAATGVPGTEAWDCSAPAGTADLREAQLMWTAVDTTFGILQAQLQARWILQFLQGGVPPGVFCHEIGHAYGFRDLYGESAHRKDLRYFQTWAIMGQHEPMAHHSGYHKWQAGWIPEARIIDVPKPDAVSPIVRETLLVPNEYWDPGMEAAARKTYGDATLQVAQLVRIDLGGDGGMFDLIEAHQRGIRFSQDLPHQPALIVSNASEPYDDTRYALNGLYRRELQLLNTGLDHDRIGDIFDFGAAPALPAKGVTVEIIDIRDVPRPSGLVRVFRINVTREKADYVDLGFTSADPYYKNPDLWIDWPGDNPGGAAANFHRSYPEGQPVDQGDAIHVPSKGAELHWMVARIRNFGTVPAQNVKLDYLISVPPGAGDHGNFKLIRTVVVPEVKPGSPIEVPAQWDVQSSDQGHACLLVRIADYEIPRDSDGIALGSDDVFKANNHAQKNFDQFVAASHSPYTPIEFDYSVNNDGLFDEIAYLEPINLSYGMKLTVSPVRRLIKSKETAIFHLKLELDDKIINAGCRNDREFTLVTWRETNETVERWGAVHYKIRPRIGTTTSIVGAWYDDSASVYGVIAPDPGAGAPIRISINFDNQPAYWLPAVLGSGGSYKIVLSTPAGATSLDTEAMFEGNTKLAPSRSAPITIRPYVVR